MLFQSCQHQVAFHAAGPEVAALPLATPPEMAVRLALEDAWSAFSAAARRRAWRVSVGVSEGYEILVLRSAPVALRAASAR